MQNLKALAVALLIPTFLAAPAFCQESPSHSLISTLNMKTENGLSCEIVVAVAADNSEVRILRLENRRTEKSANQFSKDPQIFAQYGQTYVLAAEFNLQGRKVTNVNAKMDFEGERKDVLLKITLEDDHQFEKQIPLEQDYFKDSPTNCLK